LVELEQANLSCACPACVAMCFTQSMSASFSVVGLLFAWWIHRTNGNRSLLQGVLWFVGMEVLQVAQYAVIATDIDAAAPTMEAFLASPVCQSGINRFLTVVGLLHIAFQPYHSAILFCAFFRSKESRAQLKLVNRLQIAGGCMLAARYALTHVDAATFERLGMDVRYAFDPAAWSNSNAEWLVGPVLCTYQGLTHLAWSIPLAPVSYYVPSMAIHSFLMFMPFFVVDTGNTVANVANCVAGGLLFVSGPLVADWFSSNKHEAPTIWCFFSILQILVLTMLLVIQRMSHGRWYVDAAEEKKRAVKGKRA